MPQLKTKIHSVHIWLASWLFGHVFSLVFYFLSFHSLFYWLLWLGLSLPSALSLFFCLNSSALVIYHHPLNMSFQFSACLSFYVLFWNWVIYLPLTVGLCLFVLFSLIIFPPTCPLLPIYVQPESNTFRLHIQLTT